MMSHFDSTKFDLISGPEELRTLLIQSFLPLPLCPTVMLSASYTSGLGCLCFFTMCNLAPVTCPTSFLACVCGVGGEGQFSPYGLLLGNTIYFLWWVVAALWHFYQAACGLMWLDGSTSSSANKALNLEQLCRFHRLRLHLPISPQLVFLIQALLSPPSKYPVRLQDYKIWFTHWAPRLGCGCMLAICPLSTLKELLVTFS